MKIEIPSSCWLFCFITFSFVQRDIQADTLDLKAIQHEDRITVMEQNSVLTEYRYAHAQKYPYFYPVNGPVSHQSVTTESSEPYPHHHSLFFGCDRVNGGNYWQDVNERGQIISDEVKLIESQGERVMFENRCTWKRPDAEPPLQDVRRITITAPSPTLRVIDFDITLTALIAVQVEKTNHALFSARMIPALSVNGGGTLINAEGYLNEVSTFGRESRWCHYYGPRVDLGNPSLVEGLAILPHPSNSDYPAPWFTRDYGFFSPHTLMWIDEPARMDRGDRITLRYRVVVHSGELTPYYLDLIATDWSKN